MRADQSLYQHYHLLLGLDKDWEVQEVNLSLELRSVHIKLRHRGSSKVLCPECQNPCSIFDHAPERKWRHLDTMQFETELRGRVPRCQCDRCGVKTIEVPWAGKHSPFTWMFEAFAVAVMQSAASTSEACTLLRIGWQGAHRIMERAVERGLARRSLDGFEYAGMDEKSFGSGHDYITTLNDLSKGAARVIEVVHGRKHEDALKLLNQVPEAHRSRLKAVAMDMWDAYLKAVREVLPQADIVHDRYHISAHLNAAVDRVRKDEHKQLMRMGDETLKGSKYQWMRTYPDKRSGEAVSFRKLHELDLKTSRAWHYKEDFRHFWNYLYAGAAERFYKGWRRAVMSSRLEPLKKVARLIDGHWQEILNYIKHRITNAVSEGLNSRIQSIKSAARGFRSFANYRTRILFHCGKLDLNPSKPR